MANPTKSDAITSDTSVKEVKKIILQFEAIVEESHDAIIGKTLDGIIVTWNGGATKMFGYTREEMIGKSIADLFAPENRDELPGLLEKIKKGETISDYDSIWIKKDGTKADVEFSISPVHAVEKGLIIGSSLVGRDITIRRNVEKENRSSEEKFKSIFDNAKDGILLADPESKKFVMGNKAICDMLGYNSEEILKLRVMEIHPEKDLSYVLDQFDRQSKGEFSLSRDLPVKRKDGSVFSVDVNASSVKIGEKTYLLGFFHDTTERKNAELKFKDKYDEMEKLYNNTIGRELKMIELKKEIEELKAKQENK